MSTEITVKQAGTGVLAVREGLGAGLVVAGDDRTAAEMLPRATIYQGTAQEQTKYGEGKFKRGDLIHVSEARKLASNVFVPVAGAISYVNWPKGARVPQYVLHDPSKVPAQDLKWGPNGEKPIAAKTVTLVVLFQGESTPFILSFKKTGLRAYDALKAFEANRQIGGKQVGAYRLEAVEDKDDGGNPFKRWTVVPHGEVPADMAELAAAFRSAATIHTLTTRARQAVDEEVKEAARPVTNTAAPQTAAPADEIPF